MDLNELFLACRRGDLDKVKYLIEKKECPLNVRDKWDSTPLYYACYCGHKDLVQYMLANGAKCENNTFDGERCIYGALTDEIRNILRSFKIVTSRIIRRDNYDEFLRRCFETTEFTDVIVLTTDGVGTQCHKCVLAARSPYFRDVLAVDPSCTKVMIDFKQGKLFQHLKEYIYTGRLQMRMDDENVFAIKDLAESLQMMDFVDKLFDELDKYECERSRYLKRVQNIIIEPAIDSTELADSYSLLGDEYLRKDLAELPFGSRKARAMCYSDICFLVEGVHFFAHKLFYCQRSEYFSALLRDHFSEVGCVDGNIPLITLADVSSEVFACVHDYIYKDMTDRLTSQNVFDVLCAADIFLLNGLKRYCGSFVGQNIEHDNVMMLFRCSRIFDLPRLEDQCVCFLAKNLDYFIEDEEFRQQVVDDAKEVRQRQETDTIGIIDDIRYHISANVQTYSEIEEANEKLFLIDNFLESLGLEA